MLFKLCLYLRKFRFRARQLFRKFRQDAKHIDATAHGPFAFVESVLEFKHLSKMIEHTFTVSKMLEVVTIVAHGGKMVLHVPELL